MTLLAFLALWLAASIPFALIMGRLFAVCGRGDFDPSGGE